MGPSIRRCTARSVRIRVDGESVERVDVDVGYLHRAFEKSSENATWTMIFPYTDRLNYVSPLIDDNAYAAAVEKLFDLEIPLRAKYCRTIAAEMSRMSDHFTSIGASTMELGAFTGMLYLIEARDMMWDAVEELCGARLTVSYARIGGVVQDLPPGWASLRKKLEPIAGGSSRRQHPAHPQPELSARPHEEGSARSAPRTRSPGDGRAPACAQPASRTTYAGPRPTTPTMGRVRRRGRRAR